MAREKFETVADYYAAFPKEIQVILKKVQSAIKTAVPEAEEVISYQIPAFKFHGWIFYYSAYKAHYTLSCPPPWTIFEKFKKELSPFELSKSSIKFPLDQPVPVKLIAAMAKFRAKENIELEKKKKKK
jgi:uncharacterized protein YdhG (YjbR/CyaY superfamily)